ncbi:MAG: N-6 DNA methylase [Elusimicrobiota bacterium]
MNIQIQILEQESNHRRRIFGEHFTSTAIFYKYILPYIRKDLYKYVWVDLYAGEGNLILPILDIIPKNKRCEFFNERIYLFDIQYNNVKKAIEKAVFYGIPTKIAERNITQQDTLKNFPKQLLNFKYPLFHITNPPYLYIGYIVKHGGRNLSYFQGENEGYQDLYQIALINDAKNYLDKMIYIIPSNFLFSDSGSNKIRKDFFKFYDIKKMFLFEDKIFEHTGTNVGIFFFEKKKIFGNSKIIFSGVKIKSGDKKQKEYVLKPENNYRIESKFEKFVKNYKSSKPLKIKFYITNDDIVQNRGQETVKVINANKYNGKIYEKEEIYVSNIFKKEILSNNLFIRTVDTGNLDGRVGLYNIKDVFGTDGIYAATPFRTHPIQIFLTPILNCNKQKLLLDYFNILLEYFRKIDDSEFMTTFKYSEAEYTRKYLGLTKAKHLIQTFPFLELMENQKEEFTKIIKSKDTKELIKFVSQNHRSLSLF